MLRLASVCCLKLPYGMPDSCLHGVLAVQDYPGVAHYALSHVLPDISEGKILDILSAGFANTTSKLSTFVVDYIEDTGAKSNEDTAYSWRGKFVVYIWAFFTRTAGVPCLHDFLHQRLTTQSRATCRLVL